MATITKKQMLAHFSIAALPTDIGYAAATAFAVAKEDGRRRTKERR